MHCTGKSIFDKKQLLILILLFLGFYQPVIGRVRSTYYIPVLALILILIKQIPVLDILKTRAGDVGKGLFIIEMYLLISFTVSGGGENGHTWCIQFILALECCTSM